MVRVRPGWLVALCAALVVVTAWLPWLTTTVDGGGRASAIGGAGGSMHVPHTFGAGQLIVLLAATLVVAGAMAARGLSPRSASIAALVLSLLIVASAVRYYQVNVAAPVSPGYGLYLGGGIGVVAAALSLWAVVAALSGRGSRRPPRHP
ncbi:MAG: hypothetical protein ACSLE6_12160 [Mycobacterium sp.]